MGQFHDADVDKGLKLPLFAGVKQWEKTRASGIEKIRGFNLLCHMVKNVIACGVV